jgi:hypothetical protein
MWLIEEMINLLTKDSSSEILDQDVMNLWQSLVTTIMDQLGFLINEPEQMLLSLY